MLSSPPHCADCQARLRACLVPLTCCCRRRHCLKVQHQSPLVWDQHYDLPVDHGEGGRGGIPVPQFSPRCVLLCDLAVTLVGYLAIRGATLEAVVGCSDDLLSPPLLQYAPNAPSSRDLEVSRDVG